MNSKNQLCIPVLNSVCPCFDLRSGSRRDIFWGQVKLSKPSYHPACPFFSWPHGQWLCTCLQLIHKPGPEQKMSRSNAMMTVPGKDGGLWTIEIWEVTWTAERPHLCWEGRLLYNPDTTSTGLDEEGYCRGGEKWPDSGCILKTEPIYSHPVYAGGDTKQAAGVSGGGPTGGSNFGIFRCQYSLRPCNKISSSRELSVGRLSSTAGRHQRAEDKEELVEDTEQGNRWTISRVLSWNPKKVYREGTFIFQFWSGGGV